MGKPSYFVRFPGADCLMYKTADAAGPVMGWN